MSEKLLRDVIIESSFKTEWFNKDKTIARVDYTSGKACYVPFPFLQRIFRNDRKLLISKVLPSGKCAIRFSESLKEDKYFLPCLRDGIRENVNLENIAELELRQNKVQQSFTTIEELVNPDLGGSVIMLVDHYNGGFLA